MRRIYRHVEILVKNGFAAHVLHHSPTYSNPWFSSSAPVEFWEPHYQLFSDDVLVIPEGHVEVMQRAVALPCRRVILALNWANVFRALPPNLDWRDFGISAIIAGGHYEQHFIASTMGLSSTVLVSGIDSNLFAPSSTKRCLVACMPRKNPDVFHLIHAAFRARYRHLSHIPFLSIESCPHHEVARLLSRSAVFLAHTFPEGLSRKTLEAMACGNIVVGFAGKGSEEYMTPNINCYLATDGDLLSATGLLGVALESFRAGTSQTIVDAAIATAKRYSLDSEEVNVRRFWTDFLER